MNAWPSDVTLLAFLRSVRQATKQELAHWVATRVEATVMRTVLANTASALQRLENDALIYRTRNEDDARQFIYRIQGLE